MNCCGSSKNKIVQNTIRPVTATEALANIDTIKNRSASSAKPTSIKSPYFTHPELTVTKIDTKTKE